MNPNNEPLNRLRHHVTGAIERGDAEPITSVTIMDLYNLINDLAESLDNAVLHDGKPMTPEDKYRRQRLAASARQSLRNVGYYR